jgi:aminomethyltransferase
MTKVVGFKSTALTRVHTALGAKMVPFAGYHMPVYYSTIQAEHENVRKNLGVFDVSHMGEFLLKGKDALELIQRICSNDAGKLVNGQVQYSCMPNQSGGIIDDLLIYRISEAAYMLVVNAANIEKDWAWISGHNTKGVEMGNISDNLSLLAVQGPRAVSALQCLTEIDLAALKYYTFRVGTFAGIPNVLISATGYTGAGGLELYIENECAEAAWNAIMEAGHPFGIKPAGLGARDTLRLEMGYCLYGHDIDEYTSPLEAGLGRICSFSKRFTNSKNLFCEMQQGPERKLVGFELRGRGIPRQDYLLTSPAGMTLGLVTSGTHSPSLQKGIGMGYLPAVWAEPGTEIAVLIRGERIPARVVKLPFIKKPSK